MVRVTQIKRKWVKRIGKRSNRVRRDVSEQNDRVIKAASKVLKKDPVANGVSHSTGFGEKVTLRGLRTEPESDGEEIRVRGHWNDKALSDDSIIVFKFKPRSQEIVETIRNLYHASQEDSPTSVFSSYDATMRDDRHDMPEAATEQQEDPPKEEVIENDFTQHEDLYGMEQAPDERPKGSPEANILLSDFTLEEDLYDGMPDDDLHSALHGTLHRDSSPSQSAATSSTAGEEATQDISRTPEADSLNNQPDSGDVIAGKELAAPPPEQQKPEVKPEDVKVKIEEPNQAPTPQTVAASQTVPLSARSRNRWRLSTWQTTKLDHDHH